MQEPRPFLSDNAAGLTPEALDGLREAATGYQSAYGDDAWSARVDEALMGVFETRDLASFLVATGTAANTLCIGAMIEPWMRVLAHERSHWNKDESTAPERIALCRTTTIRTDPTKIVLSDLEHLETEPDVHAPAPGVLTITNPTEYGTVYTPDEVSALAERAHAAGYRVHMDGARFANAVASLGCTPADLTWRAGVDALSFGAAKNGLAIGEAVVFFTGDARIAHAAERFPWLRKSTGHLLSKLRFVAAPFLTSLADGAWLRHAAHANGMAKDLAERLRASGLEPALPVEANMVYLSLDDAAQGRLRDAGYEFYPFGDPDDPLTRIVTSFDTNAEEVEELARILCEG